VENAQVKKAGVGSGGGKCRSKLYGTPTRDYIEKKSSYFVGLVLILPTEMNKVCLLLFCQAFVFA